MNQQNVLGKILCHRTYGAGEVTAQKGDRMTLRFQDGTERVFSLPVSVRAGAITAADPETQEWLNSSANPTRSARRSVLSASRNQIRSGSCFVTSHGWNDTRAFREMLCHKAAELTWQGIMKPAK